VRGVAKAAGSDCPDGRAAVWGDPGDGTGDVGVVPNADS